MRILFYMSNWVGFDVLNSVEMYELCMNVEMWNYER
jgi:hypothetical protein